MIRAIDSKPLDMSDQEYQHYQAVVGEFGIDVFRNIFEVEENESSPYYGFIILVKPPIKNILPFGVLYFILNVQLNQRIREFEKMMDGLRQKA